MKKELIISAALLIAASGITACMNKPTDLPPGEYERTTSSTNANGTTYKTKSSTEVEQNSNGQKTATVKTKTTKDPKGLFNKETTSESKTVIKE